MFSTNSAIFCVVLFVGQTTSLVELPGVDDNNILLTEIAIRNTVNTLFHSLKLTGMKTKPRLKEYSTVYNRFISYSLQDYRTLKEIAKLTRVDRNKINNVTANFMDVINELLNEDVDVVKKEFPDIDDDSVRKYVDQFLMRLKDLKQQYGVNNKQFHIKDDVYEILKDDNVVSYNYTMDSDNFSEFGDKDTLLEDSEFWKPELNTRRIYRGDKTKIKHFPFMASVQIFNKFHCSGCIIKSDLVITASSCLQLAWNNRFFRENPAFLSVRVGSNFYQGGGENIPTMEVYFHPDYNPKNLHNNLSILRLIRRLKFKRKAKKIKKIIFDTKPIPLSMTTDGITILGWGARTRSSIIKNPWENFLAVAVLDIYPLWECKKVYSTEYVTNKNFCAGFFSKGGGACNRDVGGPGIVNGILVGIVSFGSPICGTPDAPTVFTKLGYYADWIEDIVEMDVPSARKRTTLQTRSSYYYIGDYYSHTTTTFKIAPLMGKPKPIPVNSVDSLRMVANGKLFKEFLATMFNEKEVAEYEDLFEDKESQVNPTALGPHDATNFPEQELGEHMMEATPVGPVAATEMWQFDPDDVKLPSAELDVQVDPTELDRALNNFAGNANVDQNVFLDNNDTINLNMANVDRVIDELINNEKGIAELVNFDKGMDVLADVETNTEASVVIDKNVDEPAAIDKQIYELINADNDDRQMVYVDQNTNNVIQNELTTPVEKNKELQKDLVDLIDNIDLKEIIDTMPSAEEDKLVGDEKVIKLFMKQEAEKNAHVDDSVLTLLYLSSSEKAAQSNGAGSLTEYIIEENDTHDGISIEASAFKDLTYRNEHLKNIPDSQKRSEA